MPEDTQYEAPAVTDVTEVDAPLVGTPLGSAAGANPQWTDTPDQS